MNCDDILQVTLLTLIVLVGLNALNKQYSSTGLGGLLQTRNPADESGGGSKEMKEISPSRKSPIDWTIKDLKECSGDDCLTIEDLFFALKSDFKVLQDQVRGNIDLAWHPIIC